VTEFDEHRGATPVVGTARLLGPVAVAQQTTVRTIASVYELDPPARGHRNVVVHAVEVDCIVNQEPNLTRMTIVYPSTPQGEPTAAIPLHRLYEAIDHLAALEELGYRVTL
jgi:hypothetical protein